MTKTKIEVKRRELTAEAPEAQMAIALPAREVFVLVALLAALSHNCAARTRGVHRRLLERSHFGQRQGLGIGPSRQPVLWLLAKMRTAPALAGAVPNPPVTLPSDRHRRDVDW